MPAPDQFVSPASSARFSFDDIEYYDIVLILMNRILWFVGLFGIPLVIQAGPAVELQQREQSFTIRLNGSVNEVSPLFGPVREAEWAPGWTPQFIHQPSGGQHEGAVFTTTGADGKERLWMLTVYAPAEGQIEYVVITPGVTANQIKIRVVPDGPNHSQATIIYRHSAVTPEGNQEVAKLDDHWAEQQRLHWETAINHCLAKHHD